jgi:hypothetical protein
MGERALASDASINIGIALLIHADVAVIITAAARTIFLLLLFKRTLLFLIIVLWRA